MYTLSEPQKEERNRKKTERLFKNIIAENFPNLSKKMDKKIEIISISLLNTME